MFLIFFNIKSSYNVGLDNISTSGQTIDTLPSNYSVSMITNLNTTGHSMTAIDEEQNFKDMDFSQEDHKKLTSFHEQSQMSILSDPIARNAKSMSEIEIFEDGASHALDSMAVHQIGTNQLITLFTNLPKHKYNAESKLRSQKICK